MGRLKTLQSKVEDVLARYAVTRDDDKLLIGSIYALYYDVDMNAPFKEVLLNDKLPSFESIRRCRQKAQEEHAELRGRRNKERLEAQKDYVNYARGED